MSRKSMPVNEEALASLKQFVKRKANLECNSFPDILHLQDKIKKSTNETLSRQTLNRLFGLIKSDFKPAMDTLNILARFVGCSTFKEFELLYTKVQGDRSSSSTAQLIFSIFSKIEPEGASEQGLLQVVKNIYKILKNDDKLGAEVYPFMAVSSFGRKYFFEQFIHVDALNSYYGAGLESYLLYASGREQLFFAYSLLSYRSFLNKDAATFDYYYDKVRLFTIEEISAFSPYLMGRFFAAAIYKRAISKEESVYDSKMQETFNLLVNCTGFKAFPWIEYLAAEAFILAEDNDTAWDLVKNISIHPNEVPSYADKGLITQFNLLKLYCGFFSGRVNTFQARKDLDLLKEQPLYFLSEDYFSIYLKILEMQLTQRGKLLQKDISSHISRLIKKIGFIYLYTISNHVDLFQDSDFINGY